MRILIPVDGSSQSNAALAFVASRSTLIGTQPEVELINAQFPVPLRVSRNLGREMVQSIYEAEAGAVLKPGLAALKKAGIKASARHVVGRPGAAIGEAAAQSDADLVVMGSHGHSAFKGLLFGSVTNAVLASCSKPLLVLRGRTAPKRDSLAVGIAIDESKYGLAAVRYVIKHLALFGAAPQLHLIHVVPDLTTIVMPGLGDAPLPVFSPEQLLEAQNAGYDRTIAPAHELLAKSELKATEVRLIGNSPGDEIAAYATKKKLDLLVMGSHGYGALKSAVLGSVATRAAARCSTPLLMIRQTSRA